MLQPYAKYRFDATYYNEVNSRNTYEIEIQEQSKTGKREPKWNNNRIAIAKLNISFPSFPPYNTTTVVSVTFAYVIISSVSCVE